MKRKKGTITEPYASSVPRFGRLRRWQRVALALFVTLIALLIGGVLYGAYWGWTNYGRAKLQEVLPKNAAAPAGAKAPAVPGATQPTGQ